MGSESTKTRLVRSQDFVDTYFSGKVIDIGGGNDPVVSHAEVFDLQHGDAQHIRDYRDSGSYDCVNSSHCLEHMQDVPGALSQWWGLIKPGGYMVIVVPHEDLYEQGIWPSVFNHDHKATFRLETQDTWSPVSYDISNLMQALPGADIISAEVQDKNYDYALQGQRLGSLSKRIHKWKNSKNIAKKAVSRLLYGFLYKHYWVQSASKDKKDLPIDQTLYGALAQIQIVVRKAP